MMHALYESCEFGEISSIHKEEGRSGKEKVKYHRQAVPVWEAEETKEMA